MCTKRKKLVGVYSGKKTLTIDPQRLVEKDIVCDFVLLSSWTIENDNNDSPKPTGGSSFAYSTTNDEILWGFEAACVHELLPGQTTPFLIPVRSAFDIFARKNKQKGTAMTLAFSCFREVEFEGES